MVVPLTPAVSGALEEAPTVNTVPSAIPPTPTAKVESNGFNVKVFVAKEEGNTFEEICQLVKEDDERVQELYKSACKKLNQERIKQELVNL